MRMSKKEERIRRACEKISDIIFFEFKPEEIYLALWTIVDENRRYKRLSEKWTDAIIAFLNGDELVIPSVVEERMKDYAERMGALVETAIFERKDKLMDEFEFIIKLIDTFDFDINLFEKPFREGRRSGRKVCSFYLGRIEARSSKRFSEKAMSLYKEAADGGILLAYKYAIIHANRFKRFALSETLAREGDKRGDLYSSFILGECLVNEGKYLEALPYIDKAKYCGSSGALALCAYTYLKEDFGRKDVEKAKALMINAESIGNTRAAYELGMSYLFGEKYCPGEVDLEKAEDYLFTAARDYPEAKYHLAMLRAGRIYEKSYIPKEEKRKAANGFGNLFEDNYGPACFEIALSYLEGSLGIEKDEGRALWLLKKGVEKDDPCSMMGLAEMILEGKVLCDGEVAVRLLAKSIALNQFAPYARREAVFDLAVDRLIDMLNEGTMVEKDSELADKVAHIKEMKDNPRKLNRYMHMIFEDSSYSIDDIDLSVVPEKIVAPA